MKTLYYTLKKIYYFLKRKFKRILSPLKYKLKRNFIILLEITLALSGTLFVGAILKGENPTFYGSVKDATRLVAKDVHQDLDEAIENKDIGLGTGANKVEKEYFSLWKAFKKAIKDKLYSNIDLDDDTSEGKNSQKEQKDVLYTEETTPAERAKAIEEQTLAYEIINDNNPFLSFDEYYDAEGNLMSFQSYSDLDMLGRAGEALVLISKADMPSYERGSISEVKPSGWKLYNTKNTWGITLPDNSFYLYNRCHLIGFQLTGIDGEHCENSLLKKNLVTGTRYMNIGKMLDLENQIAEYLRRNEHNFVLYKVTPLYKGVDLVPYGLQMQGLSVDEEIKFNVVVYNIQLLDSGSIKINYSNGEATYIKEEK